MSAFDRLLEHLESVYRGQGRDLREIPTLVLAYIGDSVYHVFIRTMLLCRNDIGTASRLHRESVRYVRASAQAEVARRLTDTLTEEEKDILRRGRNTNPATVPKHAEMADYRLATGFEALIGYLYLKGSMARLSELTDRAAEIIQEAKTQDERG